MISAVGRKPAISDKVDLDSGLATTGSVDKIASAVEVTDDSTVLDEDASIVINYFTATKERGSSCFYDFFIREI